jgi:hypothetical protein
MAASSNDLAVDVLARKGAHAGEVCVDITTSYERSVYARDNECGATRLPAPTLGGFSLARYGEIHGLYGWAIVNNGVSSVVSPDGVNAMLRWLSMAEDVNCCQILLFVGQGDAYAPSDGAIELRDEGGTKVGQVDLQG